MGKTTWEDQQDANMKNVLSKANARARTNQGGFYNKTFSKTRHCWYHDLFINGREGEDNDDVISKYYHVLINVNTRFACVNPIASKSCGDVEDSLNKFIDNHACKRLISDAERAFISDGMHSFCEAHGIDVQINDEQNHKTMAIVDRFIRTLRDKWGSNKSVPSREMANIVSAYNKRVHTSTGLTPEEMENDETGEMEAAYIAQMVREQNAVQNAHDYKLNPKDKVRLIKSQSIFDGKKRRTLTKNYYEVHDFYDNKIIVMAKDGTVKTVSRADCVKISNVQAKHLDQASSFDNNRRIVRSIRNVDENTGKYRVKVANSDGSFTMTQRDIRGQFPLRPTSEELRYMKGKNRTKKVGSKRATRIRI